MNPPCVNLPSNVTIKKSPIEGWGVFALQDIPKDSCIGEFIGTPMNHAEFKSKYGTDMRHCYLKRRTWEYRVAKENRNFITYINDGIHNIQQPYVNVFLKNWFLYALKPIKAGEELLLDYGNYYRKKCL
jgi:SET domain-containing protein